MVGILFSYRGMPIFRGHVSFRRVNRKSKRMGVLGAGDFELLPGGNKVIDAIIHDESWWIIPIQYLILGGVPAWLFKGSNCIFTFGGQHAQQMKRQRNHQLQWKVRKVQSIKWKTTSLSCIPLVGASFCFFWRFFFPPRAAYKASKNSLPKMPLLLGRKSPWFCHNLKKGEIQCARDRWFRVEGHLHLGLGLTLGKIYPASDLNRQGRLIWRPVGRNHGSPSEICGGFSCFETHLFSVLAKVIQRQTSWKIVFFPVFHQNLTNCDSQEVQRRSEKA